MRIVLAAFCFLIGLYAITSAITALLPAASPEWLTGVVILVSAGLSLFLTNRLVNVRGTKFWSISRFAFTKEQLDREGLLVTKDLRARRAFQIAERAEEGPHYFIELLDGSVLYMSGSYLHDYEPVFFKGKVEQPREFPCTEFTVRRRGDDNSVVDIECRGSALEPEAVAPPFGEDEAQKGALPKDGDLITSSTYDEIKSARTAGNER